MISDIASVKITEIGTAKNRPIKGVKFPFSDFSTSACHINLSISIAAGIPF